MTHTHRKRDTLGVEVVFRNVGERFVGAPTFEVLSARFGTGRSAPETPRVGISILVAEVRLNAPAAAPTSSSIPGLRRR